MLEQAEAIFDQMERVTQAEGIGMENLIKVTIFVTSMDDVAALRQMLAKQYGEIRQVHWYVWSNWPHLG